MKTKSNFHFPRFIVDNIIDGLLLLLIVAAIVAVEFLTYIFI